jgi:hypothetical protein
MLRFLGGKVASHPAFWDILSDIEELMLAVITEFTVRCCLLDVVDGWVVDRCY